MWQVILVTLIGGLAGIESILDEWQWHRPILACTLVGLAMGDLSTGLAVGGILELTALGWMNIGASTSPDTALASIFATVLAVHSGHYTHDAIALAIPVAVAGNLMTVLVRTMTVYFQHMADRILPTSPRNYLGILHFTALSLQALRVAIPSFLFIMFANRAMLLSMFHAMPPVLSNGFIAASGFIVVVGYAMVIRSLNTATLLPYFILGFLAADFTQISLLGIGLAAVCLALLHERVWVNSDSSVMSDQEVAVIMQPVLSRQIPRQIMRRVFWRSQFEQASWNYERMQSLGYAYALEPVIDWLYVDPQAKALRKRQHLEFFNTQPYVANLVLGVNIALEEGVARGEDRAERLVTSMKLGMMGPLAGIGDSLFWGTIRPVLGAFAAHLALQGSIVGPILFFVLYNILRLGTRWGLLAYGYQLGVRIVAVMATGVVQKITEGATIIGLIVMGALVSSWTSVQFALSWHEGSTVITLNTMVNSLLPKLPSLLLVWAVVWLMNRGVSSIKVILLLFLVAIVGVWIGLLSA